MLEEIGQGRPQHRLVARAEFRLLDDRALSRRRRCAREIFGAPRGILAWGPELPGAGRGVAVDGGIRVTGRWGFATGSRHATWLGAHVPIFEPDGTPRLNPNGRPFVRTDPLPEVERRDHRQLAGHRAARHRQRQLSRSTTIFVPQKYTAWRDNEAERREPGLLYRFTSGMIYAHELLQRLARHRPRRLDAFIELARDKMPRGARGTLRENNVIQSQVAQCEAQLQLVPRLDPRDVIGRDVGRRRERTGEFRPEQHRAAAALRRPGRSTRRATSSRRSITRPAGSNAVFNENPFERRLRDIHAGTQQGQGRPIHFETVGQMLMGLPPEGRMFR